MNRVAHIDVAKAFGILLVYFAHFVEKFQRMGSAEALEQYQLIAAIVLPTFLFLSGIFVNFEKPPGQRLRALAEQRLLPLLFFGALCSPIWIHRVGLRGTVERALYYLSGDARLNTPTWFLVCLFSVEVLVVLLVALVNLNSARSRVAAMLGFTALGVFATSYARQIAGYTGVMANFFYLNEALLCVPFFLLGAFLRPYYTSSRRVRDAVVFVVATAVAVWSFGRNPGPFPDYLPSVIMNDSIHGHFGWFLITAYSGIFSIISLGKILPVLPGALFVGRNTLVYVGLNGWSYHYLDNKVIQTLGLAPSGHLETAAYGVCYGLASLVAFAPIVMLLNRLVPELVGRPWAPGSLLPPRFSALVRK